MTSKNEKAGLLGVMILTDASVNPPTLSASKPLSSKLTEWLRHPVVLLLMSSVIIPAIVYVLAKRRDLTESRQKHAFEIVNKNSVFEGELYALYTELALFHQTNIQKKPNADELKKLQADLDRSWTTHYLKFRRSYPDAHMWVDDLFGQGVILSLFRADDVRAVMSATDQASLPDTVPSNVRALSHAIEEYKGTLSQSLEELRQLRTRCISPEYEFEKAGESSKLQIKVTNKMNELRDQRTRIIASMAGLFTQ